jgi:hypothetical protein
LERDSFGVEINPGVGFHWDQAQTVIDLGYNYWLRWYEDREQSGSADHSHVFNGKLSHSFTERYKLDLGDTFVIAQEPSLLEPPGATTQTRRTDGDNIRNTATASFTAELTRLLSVVLGYSNQLYDYDNDGPASYSALLDRMEHLVSVNLRWQTLPTTVGVLGYQFGLTDHTSSDDLLAPGAGRDPSERDSRTHYIFVGADHTFNPNLLGSIRIGGQFTDYHNAPSTQVDDVSNPYADASLSWNYNPGSYVQLGIRHTRNQTDVAFGAIPAVDPTLDQESTIAYVSVSHRITGKLKGSAIAQYQNSEFKGGFADGETDDIFLVGLSLSYQINPWLSAETGYNYDRLNSDLSGRSFTRNRVYLGLRASY